MARVISSIVLCASLMSLPAWSQATLGTTQAVKNCSDFQGRDAGAKIAACVRGLSTTGGTADARAIDGAQTWSVDPFFGVTKPLDMWLSAGTTKLSTAVIVPKHVVLHFSSGSVLSVDAGVSLTIHGVIDAPPRQIFTGQGRVTIHSVPTIYTEWFGAVAETSVDSSTAIQKTIDAVKTSSGSRIVFLSGTYRANAISLNSADGLQLSGVGQGTMHGGNARTVIKYNGGGGTGIFQIDEPTSGVRFEGLNLDGNGKTGKGVWLKNNSIASVSIHFIQFSNVNFTAFSEAIQIGGNQTGFATNFNQLNGDNCTFFGNDIAIDVANNNTEFQTWRNSFFLDGGQFYFRSTAGSFIHLEHSYLGTMSPGAFGAMLGPWGLAWNDVWAELGDGVYLINVTDSAAPSTVSTLQRVLNANHGDKSNVAIYWNGGTPLTIGASTIAGRITYDRRRRDNQVYLHGVTFLPVIDSEIVQTVGTSGLRPLLAGVYTGSTADFYIRITSPNTFQYKISASGKYSGDIPIAPQVALQDGVIAQFPIGWKWTVGHEWKFPCGPTGVDESNGSVREPFIGARVSLVDNVAQAPIPNNDSTYSTVIKFDTKSFDTHNSYNVSTGRFTAMFRGFYDVRAQVGVVGATTSYTLATAIFKNGDEYKICPGNGVAINANAATECSTLVYLNPGDYIEVRPYQNSGAAMRFASSDSITVLEIAKRADLGTNSY